MNEATAPSNTLSREELASSNRKIWNMAIPVMVDNLFQLAGGLIVMVMVGHVSVLGTGAIGLAVRITSVVWAVFRGIATAATVYVAQATGAGDRARVRVVAFQSVYVTASLSALAAFAIWLFADKLLLVFAPKPEILDVALTYLRIACWGVPFLSVMQTAGGVMQGAGNTRRPMQITFALNALVALVVLPLFYFGKPDVRQAVVFAGAATVFAQATAATFALLSVFASRRQVGSMERDVPVPAPDFRVWKAILRVGIPSSAEMTLWQLAAIVLSRIILGFGSTVMGAYQLGLQLEALSYMPSAGLGVAVTSLVGQAIGAEKRHLARYCFTNIIRYNMAITAAVSLLFIFGNRFLMGLMTNDAAAIALGAVYLFLMGLVQLPQNATNTMFGAMRGAGFTKEPMYIALAGLWLVRVPVALFLSTVEGIGVEIIWTTMCADLVIRFAIALLMFRRMRIFEAKALAV